VDTWGVGGALSISGCPQAANIKARADTPPRRKNWSAFMKTLSESGDKSPVTSQFDLTRWSFR
jgi:hypothetical protein